MQNIPSYFCEKRPKEIFVYEKDIPKEILAIEGDVAVDTEAMGLRVGRDRLCYVQFSFGDGIAHLIKIHQDQKKAPHLSSLLSDPKRTKIFHFAPFDVHILLHTFGFLCQPLFCTRTASKICRTYTERHGLKEVCKKMLQIELSKESQSSDWGEETLSSAQQHYAAKDVIYLHALRQALQKMAQRENKEKVIRSAMQALPPIVFLENKGFSAELFSYGPQT